MNKILKLFIFMSFWAFFACSYEDVTIYQESHLLSFDQGNTYYVPLADTTVPNASRKKLIIHIMDPLN